VLWRTLVHRRPRLRFESVMRNGRARRFSIETDVAVYFCDPRGPWQRGSNENTNGLLRQYLPKRSDLVPFSQADLDAVRSRAQRSTSPNPRLAVTITSTRRRVAMTP
jgi:hypothetical protein